MEKSIWDLRGGMASEDAWEPPLAWECLGSCQVEGPLALGPGPGCPSGGQAGNSWPRDTLPGAKGGPLPWPKGGMCTASSGARVGGTAVEMGELREPHPHLPASGLGRGPGEGSKEEPGAHGAMVRRPRCIFGVLVQPNSPPLST